MIIDEPDLDNGERLRAAADALLRGELHVRVHLAPRGLGCSGDASDPARAYRAWLRTIIRERGHSDEAAEVLACGAIVRLENER